MKKILVTGDSKGLGYDICKTLSATEDFEVYGVSRSSNSFEWNHFSLDLFVEEDVKKLNKICKDMDVIIHNAAISSNNLFVVEPELKVKKVFKLNLFVPIEITKAWIKGRIRKKKKGCVIFVSSICTEKQFKGLSAYAASKSALNSYAKSIAFEMGKKGITSNIVSPGYMKTSMTSEMRNEDLEKIKNKTPLKRFCKTDDVCSIIEYIIKNPGFINGSNIIVDGGFTL